MRKSDRLNERGPARQIRHEINKLWDAVESLRIGSGLGYSVKRTRTGQVLEIKAGQISSGGKTDLRVVRIDTVGQDTLECYGLRADGTPGSDTYTVAKPSKLRSPSAFGEGDDATITNQTWDDEDEHQKVTYTYRDVYTVTEQIKPYYAAADIIVIAKLRDPTVTDDSGAAVLWIDMNIDGRNWFLVPREFTICDNSTGTPTEKTAVLPGSEGVVS